MVNERLAATIHQEIYEGVETYVLREPATGSQARVLPELGNNVLSFETTVAGKALSVIAPPASVAALRDYPARYSIPVLFPYPGRLAGGRFTFRGREYQLPLKAGPHVSHGTVNNRPWQVRKSESGDSSATLVSTISTETNPDILVDWPFPFELTEAVTLRQGRLRLDLQATNAGRDAMPMGLGLHPYFATPVAGRGLRADNFVAITAEKLWTQQAGIPTGETVDLPSRNVLAPRPLRDLDVSTTADPKPALNLLFTAFDATRGRASDAPGGITTTIQDIHKEYELRMETSATFGALVLFASHWTTDLSLEPHTCVPDAFNLASRGIEAGVIALEPGESWRGWVEISARRI